MLKQTTIWNEIVRFTEAAFNIYLSKSKKNKKIKNIYVYKIYSMDKKNMLAKASLALPEAKETLTKATVTALQPLVFQAVYAQTSWNSVMLSWQFSSPLIKTWWCNLET